MTQESGRCYGYDVVRDGEDRGKRTINEAEAAIVRRIYAEYVEGRSPMKIVRALNFEGIPGPRGGQWNVSALIGSAKRRNGLLNNSLYSGRITYNRQSFIPELHQGPGNRPTAGESQRTGAMAYAGGA